MMWVGLSQSVEGLNRAKRLIPVSEEELILQQMTFGLEL